MSRGLRGRFLEGFGNIVLRKRAEAEQIIKGLWEGVVGYCIEVLLLDRGVAADGGGIESV